MSTSLRVHDLLRLGEDRWRDDLVLVDPLAWDLAEDSLRRAPFVVVRRPCLAAGLVPIGIRGRTRNVRLAGWMRGDAMDSVVRPEDLRSSGSRRAMTVFRALEALEASSAWGRHGWGPTGSAGFELASGMDTVSEQSDLDIVLRAPSELPMQELKLLAKECLGLGVLVDVQVETDGGAFSLAEYVTRPERTLVRTVDGPVLRSNPWRTSELGLAAALGARR